MNMTPEAIRSKSGDNDMLPALPFDSWKDTLATLHMWSQIVGKVRLKLCPLVNHWWNVPFYITARGMTTSPMPYEQRDIEVQFDFIEHKILIETSEGRVVTMAMAPQSVADFYKKFMAALAELGINVRIRTMPCEIPDPIPFEQDNTHSAYDPEAAHKFWRILVWVDTEEHTSELQSLRHLVCRLLLEKKKEEFTDLTQAIDLARLLLKKLQSHN